jgi:hypothetical protein
MECTTLSSMIGDWTQGSCPNLMTCVPKALSNTRTGLCTCEISLLLTSGTPDSSSCHLTAGTYGLVAFWVLLAVASLAILAWLIFVAYCGHGWGIFSANQSLTHHLAVLSISSILMFVDRVLWISALFLSDSTSQALQHASFVGVDSVLNISTIISLALTCRVVCLEMEEARMCSTIVVKTQMAQLACSTIVIIAIFLLAKLFPSPRFSFHDPVDFILACFAWAVFRRLHQHLNYDRRLLVFSSFVTTAIDREFVDLRNSIRVLTAAIVTHALGSLISIFNIFVVRSNGRIDDISAFNFSAHVIQNSAIIVGLASMVYILYSIAYIRIEKASRFQQMSVAASPSSTRRSRSATTNTFVDPRDSVLLCTNTTTLEDGTMDIECETYGSSTPCISEGTKINSSKVTV